MWRTNCETTKGNKTKQEIGGSQQRITPQLTIPGPDTPSPNPHFVFFKKVTAFLNKLGCQVAVRQRSEEQNQDLTLTHPWVSSESASLSIRRKCTDKYSCANTICNHSSAAWLCKCHLSLPVKLHTDRFSICFGTKESGTEGKVTARGSFVFSKFILVLVILRHL